MEAVPTITVGIKIAATGTPPDVLGVQVMQLDPERTAETLPAGGCDADLWAALSGKIFETFRRQENACSLISKHLQARVLH